MGKFPIKVEIEGVCPLCGEAIHKDNPLDDGEPHWQCVDCGEVHADKEDAYHCCE